MYEEKINEMEDGKHKEMLKIINEGGKPYMRKCDGYAIKLTEEKELTFKEGDQETTIKIPAGDYIKVSGDSCYPEIETAESFEKKNKIISEDKSKKEDRGPKIGISLMS